MSTELILEMRYMLRPLKVIWDGPTLLQGDSMSVVLNTSVPSSVRKEKHNPLSAGVIHFAFTKNEENISNVFTKLFYLDKELLLCTPDAYMKSG